MVIQEKDLGDIKLIERANAKKIIVRYRDGMFLMSHPIGSSIDELERIVVKMKPKLLALKANLPDTFIFDESTHFETLTFVVDINRNNLSNIYPSLKNGCLSISFPQHICIEDHKAQLYIKEIIESACRSEAKRIIPQRIVELAKIHDFVVNEVKINKSRTRWGSCSSKKVINISYFCMMLPKHLLDLILLHELCHTKEMNHGEGFWKLLDRVTDNQSKFLTKELKQVKLNW